MVYVKGCTVLVCVLIVCATYECMLRNVGGMFRWFSNCEWCCMQLSGDDVIKHDSIESCLVPYDVGG